MRMDETSDAFWALLHPANNTITKPEINQFKRILIIPVQSLVIYIHNNSVLLANDKFCKQKKDFQEFQTVKTYLQQGKTL